MEELPPPPADFRLIEPAHGQGRGITKKVKRPVTKAQKLGLQVDFGAVAAGLGLGPEDAKNPDLFCGVRQREGFRVKEPSFRAAISIDGDGVTIGHYPNAVLAALAYDSVAREYKLPVNFPRDGEKKAVPHKKRKTKAPLPLNDQCKACQYICTLGHHNGYKHTCPRGR